MFPVNVSCHAKVLIAASFIAAFSPILPAQAADVVDVRGSQPTVIYSMGIYYTNDCYAGPLPRLQKGYSRAQHGKLTSKVETGTISKGHCKGKPVKRTRGSVF